jgi:hypothetical protein
VVHPVTELSTTTTFHFNFLHTTMDKTSGPGMAKAESDRKRGPTDNQRNSNTHDKVYNDQIEKRMGRATNPNQENRPTGFSFNGPGRD